MNIYNFRTSKTSVKACLLAHRPAKDLIQLATKKKKKKSCVFHLPHRQAGLGDELLQQSFVQRDKGWRGSTRDTVLYRIHLHLNIYAGSTCLSLSLYTQTQVSTGRTTGVFRPASWAGSCSHRASSSPPWAQSPFPLCCLSPCLPQQPLRLGIWETEEGTVKVSGPVYNAPSTRGSLMGLPAVRVIKSLTTLYYS